MDRLLVSSALLYNIIEPQHNPEFPYNVALSSPIYDLVKNNALVWLRLHGVLSICLTNFKPGLRELMASKDMKNELLEYFIISGLIEDNLVGNSVHEHEHEREESSLSSTMLHMLSLMDISMHDFTFDYIEQIVKIQVQRYIKLYPKDKDIGTFKSALKAMK